MRRFPTILLLLLAIQTRAIAQSSTPIQVSPAPVPSNPNSSPANGVEEESEPAESPEELEPAEPGEEPETPPGIPNQQQPPGTIDANPLNPAGDSLDRLIREGINADLWQDLKGDLPCLEATDNCIAQLQSLGTQRNPLLKDLDNKIEEINTRIEEARKQNRRSISLAVFTPAVQYIFQGQGAVTGNAPAAQGARNPGPLDRLFGVFTGITGINNLLSAVGVPIFQALTGGGPQAQQNNIAIADLQVKTAQLVAQRATLANEVRNKIVGAILEFDIGAREFQLSQEVARRESDRFALIDVEYRLGQGDTNSYLSAVTSLDQKKAAAFRAWNQMRRRISEVKLLVLGTDEL